MPSDATDAPPATDDGGRSGGQEVSGYYGRGGAGNYRGGVGDGEGVVMGKLGDGKGVDEVEVDEAGWRKGVVRDVEMGLREPEKAHLHLGVGAGKEGWD